MELGKRGTPEKLLYAGPPRARGSSVPEDCRGWREKGDRPSSPRGDHSENMPDRRDGPAPLPLYSRSACGPTEVVVKPGRGVRKPASGPASHPHVHMGLALKLWTGHHTSLVLHLWRGRLQPLPGPGPDRRPGHHSGPLHGHHRGASEGTGPGPGVLEPRTPKLCVKATCHHVTLLAFLQREMVLFTHLLVKMGNPKTDGG